MCDLWTKIQNKLSIKLSNQNSRIQLGSKTKVELNDIKFNVIIVSDKAFNGINDKLYMRSLSQIKEMQEKKIKP